MRVMLKYSDTVLNQGFYQKCLLSPSAFRPRSSNNTIFVRKFATPTSDEKVVETFNDESEDLKKREAEIEKICNKSRLRPEHRHLLFDQKPYSEPVIKAHYTVRYQRKLYGKYGKASGVYPGIMWPTKSDIAERKEYEKVAYPFTIQELVNAAKSEIVNRENENLIIHQNVIDNMAKLNMWKTQLKDKILQKEAKALEIREKKEKLVEEVRRHFGFMVDPRDERFTEMLALKEKEQKKKERKERNEEKERKAIARLMEKHSIDSDSNKSNENS